MRSFLIFWTICFFLTISVNAQTTDNNPLRFLRSIPPSPEAAQITRYGLYPVTPYTGLANISIPLFSINDGNFKLPLSLDYFTGGMKVDELASCIGMGWSISAGGAITRTVIGIPDDNPQKGILDIGIKDEKAVTYLDYALFRDILNQDKDSEPDLYAYSFNGVSGKFTIFPDGKVLTIPFNNKINIKYKRTPVSGELTEFSINDENGNIYIFNSTEFSTSYNDIKAPKYWPNTSWYLTDILCNNQVDTIHFKYLRANIKTTSYSYTATANQTQLNMTKNYNDYTNRYVSEIKFRNGVVTFDYQSGRLDYGNYILNSVSLFNSNDTLVKKVFLDHDYMFSEKGYNPYAYPQDKYRLRLLSVYEMDSKGKKLAYNLTYDDAKLPPRINCGTDWWGFYNGANNNHTFMSNDVECPYYLGNNIYQFNTGSIIQIPAPDIANRDSNADSAKAGMLTKITYPTGGSAAFEFEANQYETTVAVPTTHSYFAAAETNDGPTNSYEVVTFIADIDRSANMTISLPLYNDINQPRILLDDVTAGTSVLNLTTFAGEQTSRTVSTNLKGGHTYRITASVKDNPSLPDQEMRLLGTVSWQTTELAIVSKPGGGLRVKAVRNYDVNGALKGQELYKYGTNENGAGSMSYSPFMLTQRYLDNHYTVLQYDCFVLPDYLGLIILDNPWYGYSDIGGSRLFYTNVAKYENSYGNDFIKTTYEYDPSGDEKLELPYKDQRIFVNFNWQGGNLLRQCSYKLEQQQYKLLKKTEYQYNKIEVEQRTGLKVGEKLIAEGDMPPYQTSECLFNKLFYCYNYPIVSGISVPTSQVDTLFESNGNLATQTNYTYSNLKHVKPTVITTIKSDGNKLESNFKYVNDYAAITGTDALSKGITNFLNRNMNVTLEQTDYFYRGTDKMLTSSLLGIPDISTTNIKSTSLVRSATFLTDFNPLVNQAGTMVADSRYQKQLNIDLYDQYANALQFTENNAIVTSKIWDYKNEYQVAQVTNAAYSSIAYTSFEADGYGNWKGIVPSNILTGGVTGKKCYNIASGNIQKDGLNSSEKYIVSFWAKQGAGITVSNAVMSRTGKTKGDWTCYEYEVTGTATITISGSGYIDELRSYPATAQMTTYTYEPLIGISSQCDARNGIQYFEYDSMGRLLSIRDMDGMILKYYGYEYTAPIQ